MYWLRDKLKRWRQWRVIRKETAVRVEMVI